MIGGERLRTAELPRPLGWRRWNLVLGASRENRDWKLTAECEGGGGLLTQKVAVDGGLEIKVIV